MTTKTQRTATDIMVQHIKLAGLEAKALAFVHEAGDLRKAISPDATECKAGFGPYGFVETSRGLFMLNAEGVGSGPVTDDDPYVISFYPSTPNSFAIMPACSMKLGPADIRELADSTRTNLADFIRSFGERLDRNYHNWRQTLIGV